MGGYSGRKQTHVLKLSMAIAAADSLELDIEQSHLKAAVKLLEQMELLLPEVYGEIHATEFGKDTKIVLAPSYSSFHGTGPLISIAGHGYVVIPGIGCILFIPTSWYLA